MPDTATALRDVRSLPGPRPWPLLGNVLQMPPRRMHKVVEDWARRFGSLFVIYFARTPILVVADTALIAAILRDRPDGFRRPAITAMVSDELGGYPGVFLAEGAEWRNQRRMVMQGFAPHAIKAYFPSLVKVALRLEARWQGAAHSGRAIDLALDLKRYTVDIIAGLAFGAEVNTLDTGEDAIQGHIDEVLTGTARRTVSPVPYWRWFKLPQDRRLERSLAALQGAVDGFVAKARARMQADPGLHERPQNLLEAMLAAGDKPDSGVTDATVAGNVSTMLMAGEDTTANTLAWLIWLLSRHPAALARAQEEVRRLAPQTGAFTLEQMDALEFVDACAQEAMRLKPVAPFIPLEAVRDTVVGDVPVKAGAFVWCVLRHETVDDAHFANAATFDPQRWLQADARHKASMPFGSGPRLCPGRYLALLEIKIAMALLLGRFDISAVEAVDGGEPKEVMGFVMQPGRMRMRLDLHCQHGEVMAR